MQARVMSIQIQPGKMDEALSILRDSLVPVMKQQHGFRGLLTLIDRDASKGMTVSLWETEADMRGGETSGQLPQLLTQVVHVFAGPAIREHYEVSLQI